MRRLNVCYWHKADIPVALSDVRFWGQSGHRGFRASCLLLNDAVEKGLVILGPSSA
jgi:hypothetical protein